MLTHQGRNHAQRTTLGWGFIRGMFNDDTLPELQSHIMTSIKIQRVGERRVESRCVLRVRFCVGRTGSLRETSARYQRREWGRRKHLVPGTRLV